MPAPRPALLALLVLALPLPAAAAPEPYGGNIGTWRFTQDMVGGTVVCRAHRPRDLADLFPLRLARRGNGQYTMEVPAANVPRGRHDEASFEVGRSAEPVNASADGAYLVIPVDDDMLVRAARAGGFRWAVNGRRQTGNVALDAQIVAIVERLRQCTRANGGR